MKSRTLLVIAFALGLLLPREVPIPTWKSLSIPQLLTKPVEAAVSKPSLYELSFSAGVLAAPADSTTYYFGNSGTVSPDTTENRPSRIRILHNGRIISVGLEQYVAGTLASLESSTINLRKNATTDTLLDNSLTNGSIANTALYDAISGFVVISVTKNDRFQFKLVTPAWATNPTNLSYMGTILLEADSR